MIKTGGAHSGRWCCLMLTPVVAQIHLIERKLSTSQADKRNDIVSIYENENQIYEQMCN